ncbi:MULTISPECIES: hypothetical protein [unclassified Brevundimonas]|uniref:hypothetical protein n=1 Tax=unclassified Brevundimonas TaxID=2622653 RepID=UPI001ADEB8E9|nr:MULTISPECIES: hypothetical protein [unclassified Brevundimonas]
MTTKPIIAAYAAAALCALAAQVQAQTPTQTNSLMLEANIAKASDLTGAELGVGWRFNAGNFHLTPAIGALIYQGDNDRYQIYQQSNGARCRDTTNGQYARSELCDSTAAAAYGRIEATVHWRNVEFGAGYRISDIESAPYGTIALRVSEMVAIKANLGEDYIGAGVSVRRW